MRDTEQLDPIEHARRVFARGEMLRQRRAEIARLAEIRRARRATS